MNPIGVFADRLRGYSHLLLLLVMIMIIVYSLKCSVTDDTSWLFELGAFAFGASQVTDQIKSKIDGSLETSKSS